ncbi:MAG: hypothetical protein MUF45_18190 [Spirosomaceae bacterium]|jgi:hypothetical protein|nr:hypothetical protein [Spirosomataceae bacterium]
MDSPFYKFEILADAHKFNFESIGINGSVLKSVIYSETNIPEYYNLALGDIRPDGSIDVFSRSNNGDLEKILATVIQTLLVFFSYYPNAKVVFTGSTQPRTRLYQIVLSKELKNITSLFTVLGLYDGFL